jgi:hypothetical protein
MTMNFFDGRGRWSRYPTRNTVNDYLRLDAQAVGRKADGAYIWRWSWSNWLSGEHHAEIAVVIESPLAVVLHYRQRGEQHEQQVRIRRTPTHNGGSRLDWHCPRCGRPARYLYGAPFACRTCHNLAYPSQQASHQQAGSYAVKRRQAVIRRKLKMSPDAESLPEQRPPGVRWRTWLRLSDEFRELRHVETEYMLRLIYSGNGPALWEQIGLNRAEVMPHLRPATDMAGYRMRKRLHIYEPEDWLVKLLRSRRRGRVEVSGLTINQLAKQAGVPLDFARESEAVGLLRPDRDRGRRWPKYRPKLASWLVKLAKLRADGLTWPEIAAWSKRRWQTGEICFPGKTSTGEIPQ